VQRINLVTKKPSLRSARLTVAGDMGDVSRVHFTKKLTVAKNEKVDSSSGARGSYPKTTKLTVAKRKGPCYN